MERHSIQVNNIVLSSNTRSYTGRRVVWLSNEGGRGRGLAGRGRCEGKGKG